MSRKQVACFVIFGKSFPILEGMNSIGREAEANVILKDLKFSKKHAIISVIGDKHYLTDFNSSNGTKIDNQVLKPFIFYNINDSSNIVIGDTVGVYHIQSENSEVTTMKTSLKEKQLKLNQNSQIDKDLLDAPTQQLTDSSSKNTNNTKYKSNIYVADTQVLNFDKNTENTDISNKKVLHISNNDNKTKEKEIIFCDDTLNLNDNMNQSLLDIIVDDSLINNSVNTENESMVICGTQEIESEKSTNRNKKFESKSINSQDQKNKIISTQQTENVSDETKDKTTCNENDKNTLVDNKISDSDSETDIEEESMDYEAKIKVLNKLIDKNTEEDGINDEKSSNKQDGLQKQKKDAIESDGDETDCENSNGANFDIILSQNKNDNFDFSGIKQTVEINYISDNEEIDFLEPTENLNFTENTDFVMPNNENNKKLETVSSGDEADDNIDFLAGVENLEMTNGRKNDTDNSKIDVSSNINENLVTSDNKEQNVEFLTPRKPVFKFKNIGAKNECSEKVQNEKKMESQDDVDFLAPTQCLAKNKMDFNIEKDIVEKENLILENMEDDFLAPTQELTKEKFGITNKDYLDKLEKENMDSLNNTQEDTDFLAPTQPLNKIKNDNTNREILKNLKNVDNENFVLSENTEEYTDFSAPTQPITKEKNITNISKSILEKEKNSISRDINLDETDFLAPTQPLAIIESSTNNDIKKPGKEKPDDFKFLVPSQPLIKSHTINKNQYINDDDDINFLAPTQELINNSMDLNNPEDENTELNENIVDKKDFLQIENTNNFVESESDIFSSSTQILTKIDNKEPVNKINKMEKSGGKNQNIGNDTIFSVETQKLEVVKKIAQNIDTDFSAPTQKLNNVDLDDTENEYFLAPTQKLIPTLPKNTTLENNDDDEIFLIPTQKLIDEQKTNKNQNLGKEINVVICEENFDEADFSAATQKLSGDKNENEIINIDKNVTDNEAKITEESNQKLIDKSISLKVKNKDKTLDKNTANLNKDKKIETKKINEIINTDVDKNITDIKAKNIEKLNQKLINTSIKVKNNDKTVDENIKNLDNDKKIKTVTIDISSDDSNDSEIIIKKKRVRKIKETQEATENSDSDSDVGYKHKRVTRLIETQEIEGNTKKATPDNKNMNKSNIILNNYSYTDDENIIIPNTQLEESMKLILEDSPKDKSDKKLNETETLNEFDLPTQKVYFAAINDRPDNPIAQVFSSEETQNLDTQEIENMPSCSFVNEKKKNQDTNEDIFDTQIIENSEDTTNDSKFNKNVKIILTKIDKKSEIDENKINKEKIDDSILTGKELKNEKNLTGTNIVLNEFVGMLNVECDNLVTQVKNTETEAPIDINESLDNTTDDFGEYCNAATQPIDEIFTPPKVMKKTTRSTRSKKPDENIIATPTTSRLRNKKIDKTEDKPKNKKTKQVDVDKKDEKAKTNKNEIEPTRKSTRKRVSTSENPENEDVNKNNLVQKRNLKRKTINEEPENVEKIDAEPSTSKKNKNANEDAIKSKVQKTDDKIKKPDETKPENKIQQRNLRRKTINEEKIVKIDKNSSDEDAEDKIKKSNTAKNDNKTVMQKRNLRRKTINEEKINNSSDEEAEDKIKKSNIPKIVTQKRNLHRKTNVSEDKKETIKIDNDSSDEDVSTKIVEEKRTRRTRGKSVEIPNIDNCSSDENTNKVSTRTVRKRHIQETIIEEDEKPKIDDSSSDESKSKSKKNKNTSDESTSGLNDTIGPKGSKKKYEQLNITNLNPTPSSSRVLKIKHKVVFTMLENTNLEATVTRLGGTIVNSSQECTVLVTTKISRSLKFLVAVSLGKPIVQSEWITASGKAHRFLDPWDYILIDKESEAKFDFNLENAIRLGGQKILNDYTVLLLVSKNADVLKEIIETCGGKCVTRLPKNTKPNTIIVSYEEDKSKYVRYIKQKPPMTIVAAEAIFSGALRQKLNLNDHLLT